MPITPYANGEPHLKRSTSYSAFSKFQLFYLLAGLQKATVIATLSSKASSNLLMTKITNAFVLVSEGRMTLE